MIFFSKKISQNEFVNRDDRFFDRLRKKEYSRLDKEQHVYLDYTGGNIYPQSLPEKHCNHLKNIFGNPHSSNPASRLSEKFINAARKKVLEFFNAANYECVFTANATAALKIVGECYPFSAESHLLLTADNHNSVNGIRDYCRARGACYTYIPLNEKDLSVNEEELFRHLHLHNGNTRRLFAFPAQSNVSGNRHSLSWIKDAHASGWDVLLDAAAFVPTSRLDLSITEPDFVPISFYKIFGYPTGIGCLLIKKSIFPKLKKPWFAGGTVTVSSVRYSGYFLKPDHEKFEDGTINYLAIPAIIYGLDFISSIGMEKIHNRVKDLSRLFLRQIFHLKHRNGHPLIKLYGSKNTENRGGTFLLNFYDCRGELFPFQYVEEKANKENISLRTGCFCNPGIDETNHGLPAEKLQIYYTGRKAGDYYDMTQYLGIVRGAIRVSFGFPTNTADISRFIAFAKTFLNMVKPAAGSTLSTIQNEPIFPVLT